MAINKSKYMSYSDKFKILKIRDMARIFNIVHRIDFKIAFSIQLKANGIISSKKCVSWVSASRSS